MLVLCAPPVRAKTNRFCIFLTMVSLIHYFDMSAALPRLGVKAQRKLDLEISKSFLIRHKQDADYFTALRRYLEIIKDTECHAIASYIDRDTHKDLQRLLRELSREHNITYSPESADTAKGVHDVQQAVGQNEGLALRKKLYRAIEIFRKVCRELDFFAWQQQKQLKYYTRLGKDLDGKTLQDLLDESKTLLCKLIDQEEEFFQKYYRDLMGMLKNAVLSWVKKDEVDFDEVSQDDLPEEQNILQEQKNEQRGRMRARSIGLIRFPRTCNCDQITPKMIRTFLKKFVKMDSVPHKPDDQQYSSLVNDYSEGHLEVSKRFEEHVLLNYDFVGEDLCGDRRIVFSLLLRHLLGGLWFYLDWTEQEITDELYIAKVFKETINKFKLDWQIPEFQEKLRAALYALYVCKYSDIKGIKSDNRTFDEIKKMYNRAFAAGRLLDASHTWAWYLEWRGQELGIKKQAQDCVTAVKEIKRKYLRLYLDPEVTHIVYRHLQGQVKLDVAALLTELRSVGMSKELIQSSSEERANIFVPKLYLLLEKNDDPQGFKFHSFPLTYDICELPVRILGRGMESGILPIRNAETQETYYSVDKQHHKDGSVLLHGEGAREVAEKDIEKVIKSPFCAEKLHHSERVLIACLSQEKFVKKMCDEFIERLSQGTYKLHGVLMLAYSRNSVCDYCTPALYVLAHSHDKGFLKLLEQHLKFSSNETTTVALDTSKKLPMTCIVTARIDFSDQAKELADEGQHLFNKASGPPKCSKERPDKFYRPNAKMMLPHHELSVFGQSSFLKGVCSLNQTALIEFVGATMHTALQTHEGLIFTSSADKDKSNEKPKGGE